MEKRYEFHSDSHLTIITHIEIKDGIVHGVKVGRMCGSSNDSYLYEACEPVEFYGVGNFTLTEFRGELR